MSIFNPVQAQVARAKARGRVRRRKPRPQPRGVCGDGHQCGTNQDGTPICCEGPEPGGSSPWLAGFPTKSPPRPPPRPQRVRAQGSRPTPRLSRGVCCKQPPPSQGGGCELWVDCALGKSRAVCCQPHLNPEPINNPRGSSIPGLPVRTQHPGPPKQPGDPGYTSADLHRRLYGTDQHPMDPSHPRWQVPGAQYPDPSTVYPTQQQQDWANKIGRDMASPCEPDCTLCFEGVCLEHRSMNPPAPWPQGPQVNVHPTGSRWTNPPAPWPQGVSPNVHPMGNPGQPWNNPGRIANDCLPGAGPDCTDVFYNPSDQDLDQAARQRADEIAVGAGMGAGLGVGLAAAMANPRGWSPVHLEAASRGAPGAPPMQPRGSGGFETGDIGTGPGPCAPGWQCGTQYGGGPICCGPGQGAPAPTDPPPYLPPGCTQSPNWQCPPNTTPGYNVAGMYCCPMDERGAAQPSPEQTQQIRAVMGGGRVPGVSKRQRKALRRTLR